jgi:hypothetical protein
MVRELQRHCGRVWASDIETGTDFLGQMSCSGVDVIITNPPYALAQEFIEHAIELTRETSGVVAMLLRTDYGHAAMRQHLFSGCQVFAKKLVLTKRIVWFDGPGAAPSFNHAWYIWDHTHAGPPVLAYGPPQASSDEATAAQSWQRAVEEGSASSSAPAGFLRA